MRASTLSVPESFLSSERRTPVRSNDTPFSNPLLPDKQEKMKILGKGQANQPRQVFAVGSSSPARCTARMHVRTHARTHARTNALTHTGTLAPRTGAGTHTNVHTSTRTHASTYRLPRRITLAVASHPPFTLCIPRTACLEPCASCAPVCPPARPPARPPSGAPTRSPAPIHEHMRTVSLPWAPPCLTAHERAHTCMPRACTSVCMCAYMRVCMHAYVRECACAYRSDLLGLESRRPSFKLSGPYTHTRLVRSKSIVSRPLSAIAYAQANAVA